MENITSARNKNTFKTRVLDCFTEPNQLI